MPRIVTGALSYAAVVRNLIEGTYEYGSRAYFGSTITGVAGAGNEIYMLYFTPIEGELQELSVNDIMELRIRLTVKKRTTTDTETDLFYQIYSSAQHWGSPPELYDIIGEGNSYNSDWKTFSNTLDTQEVVIRLTGTDALYAARYGLSVMNPGLSDIVEVTAYYMEADVSDGKVQPVISLINGFGQVRNGTYYHNPANEMTLIVNYTQETGDTIGRLTAEITTKNGVTRSYQGERGLNSVDIPDEVWSDLPENGTLRLYCYSSSGVYSETIEYPFVVSQYDISFASHTSGTIIQSDDPLTVTWEAILPDNIPYIEEPTKYIRYIWYDDNKQTNGTYTTGKTHTISAEELNGHRSVHIAVCEVYGENMSSRDLDYAPVLNLYIQQMAGVESVTVLVNWQLITVNWESAGQTAYQVRVGDVYDSGPIWGSGKKHKVPYIFEPGIYIVQVRLQDENGTWGEWTVPVLANVRTAFETEKDHMTATATKDGVVITIDTTWDDAVYTSIVLFRDGKLIAQMKNADLVEYTDKNAAGICTYKALGALASGAFERYAPVTIDATPKTDGMFLPDGTWIPLRYSKQFPRRYQGSLSEETYAKYYAGREYPVFMRSGRKNAEVPLAYADLSNDLADKLEDAVGETVIWKNKVGQVIHGELNGVSAYRGRKTCEVSFVINRMDYTDEILYTWPEE